MAKKTAKSKSRDCQAMPPQPMEGRIAGPAGSVQDAYPVGAGGARLRARLPRHPSWRCCARIRGSVQRSVPRVKRCSRKVRDEDLRSAQEENRGRFPGGVGYGMFYDARQVPYRLRPRHVALRTRSSARISREGTSMRRLYLTAHRSRRGREPRHSLRIGAGNEHPLQGLRLGTIRWNGSPTCPSRISPHTCAAPSRTDGACRRCWSGTAASSIGTNRWRNEVLLRNRAADQVGHWSTGSTTPRRRSSSRAAGWAAGAKIVRDVPERLLEHPGYLGFLNAMLDGAQRRRPMGPLGRASPRTRVPIRHDGQGFSPLFLDPNYSFVVKS